jgi:hypothetical protein
MDEADRQLEDELLVEHLTEIFSSNPPTHAIPLAVETLRGTVSAILQECQQTVGELRRDFETRMRIQRQEYEDIVRAERQQNLDAIREERQALQDIIRTERERSEAASQGRIHQILAEIKQREGRLERDWRHHNKEMEKRVVQELKNSRQKLG